MVSIPSMTGVKVSFSYIFDTREKKKTGPVEETDGDTPPRTVQDKDRVTLSSFAKELEKTGAGK